MGLRAMELTSMRSSLGPGTGVGRDSMVRGPPLEGRTAARCSVDIGVGLKSVLRLALAEADGLARWVFGGKTGHRT